MKNKFIEACFSLLAVFLFACGFSALVFIGMLLMPFAFIAVFVLAIREIIICKTKINPREPDMPKLIKKRGRIKHVVFEKWESKRAA